MAGVKTRGATAGICPYNPTRGKGKSGLKGHDKNREKVRGIALNAAKLDAPHIAAINTVLNTIPEEDRVVPKTNGSFYLIGEVRPQWPVRKGG